MNPSGDPRLKIGARVYFPGGTVWAGGVVGWATITGTRNARLSMDEDEPLQPAWEVEMDIPARDGVAKILPFKHQHIVHIGLDAFEEYEKLRNEELTD